MNTRIVNIDLDKNNIINLDVNLMLYRLAVFLPPFTLHEENWARNPLITSVIVAKKLD